ncbi:MAG: RNA 2',3'-cyclic phosphodiesterase [Coriobacteriia bacterium]|nr:RNA 2',3'-cyclic phosphodiesterase [Coriobacteriia bacterium]
MRAFVAVALPEPALRLLAAAQEAFVGADPSWRDEKWVPDENLHLTLRFLGDIPAEDAVAVTEALQEAVRGRAPFEVRLSSVRAVPSPGRARLLWAAFADPAGSFPPLARALGSATARWCAEPVPEPFRPHATLVRARRPRRVAPEALAAADAVLSSAGAGDGAVSVRHVMLVASTLTRCGPVYEHLAAVPLGPG